MRPSSLTPQLQRKLVAFLRSGLPRTSACRAAGIGIRTFYDWMAKAKAGDKACRSFRTAVKRAENLTERRWLSRIDTAARDPKHWTAAAWLLERRWPEKYALRLTRMIEAEREAMLAELRKTMTPDNFAEVARALVAAQQNARGRGREHAQRSTH